MTVAARPLFAFDNSYVRELEGLYEPWPAAPMPAPRMLAFNADLAAELGVDPEALQTALTGNAVLEGAAPIAQVYAGHQFGGYSPRLGDGRALLLGEVLDVHGRRRDLHQKGSGRTPFARGGDGKAVIGPMLREYVIGEAMHALGIPTTRALAVVATGDRVMRERPLPGAVLTRVAASHLRVGTFEYASRNGDVKRLANYAIARHFPDTAEADNPYLTFYDRVVASQAALIAQWMLVGFIHGVMNTDNMAISGETLDYGPCAFMDAFDPATVFSSIDHAGRYAYGHQPDIAQWNLARLAETLLPLIDAETERAVTLATEALRAFNDRFEAHWESGMRAKLGLAEGGEDVAAAALDLLRTQNVDYTAFFRSLSAALRGDSAPARALFAAPEAFDAWEARWRAQLPRDADTMDRVNPLYIPRNHQVEAALTAATDGDLEPFDRLVEVVRQPFDERPGLEAYATPAPESFGPYRTYCGT